VVTDENGLFDAGRDLTLFELNDRRVGLSLSQGRGYGVDFCSVMMRSWVAWLRGIILLAAFRIRA